MIDRFVFFTAIFKSGSGSQGGQIAGGTVGNAKGGSEAQSQDREAERIFVVL